MPVLIAGVGLLFSIIGTWVIKIKDNDAKEKEVQGAFNLGNWGSLLLTAVASFFIIQWMLPAKMNMEFFGEGVREIGYNRVFYAVLIGLAVGGLISMLTEYYTAMGKKPVNSIIQNSSTGAATNIISGLSLGMMSTAAPIILFAGAIWGAYACAGFYGVAIGASAMMATTALQLAIDAFGPIADNAGGIAEMAELDPEVRERTDILDAVGNTTAAVGKGFAIASAALTALALFAAYVTFTGIDGINIFKAKVLAALFIGGMIPVVFSAMAMSSVGKAAMAMVKEVRRQFKEIPGIMKGESEPEYEKCVDISTKAALKEMMLPGLVTIVSPIIIGFAMGAEALGSYMAGVTVSGVLWAIFQNNAGGAWDNAKKSFEAGVEIDGEMTFKGSDAHKAAVTGDTVGDPFKDTSGPSMNILIKLTCLVGLVIAPILGGSHHDEDKTLPPPPPKQASIQKNCEKKCCSMKSDKELLVFVDMDTKQSDTSVLNITSISGEDTLTNEVITVAGDDLDIDSIVNLAKEKANRLFKTSADCKKPCCMGCKATDTLQLAASCLADHSCCNPNFK